MTPFQEKLLAAAKQIGITERALHTNCQIIISEELAQAAIDAEDKFQALLFEAVPTSELNKYQEAINELNMEISSLENRCKD
jgi:hypothetical protein